MGLGEKLFHRSIAYQIGWGKFLIRWYESGNAGKLPVISGDGFSTWDYATIDPKHFCQNYRYDSAELQDRAFQEIVVPDYKSLRKSLKRPIGQVGISVIGYLSIWQGIAPEQMGPESTPAPRIKGTFQLHQKTGKEYLRLEVRHFTFLDSSKTPLTKSSTKAIGKKTNIQKLRVKI